MVADLVPEDDSVCRVWEVDSKGHLASVRSGFHRNIIAISWMSMAIQFAWRNFREVHTYTAHCLRELERISIFLHYGCYVSWWHHTVDHLRASAGAGIVGTEIWCAMTGHERNVRWRVVFFRTVRQPA